MCCAGEYLARHRRCDACVNDSVARALASHAPSHHIPRRAVRYCDCACVPACGSSRTQTPSFLPPTAPLLTSVPRHTTRSSHSHTGPHPHPRTPRLLPRGPPIRNQQARRPLLRPHLGRLQRPRHCRMVQAASRRSQGRARRGGQQASLGHVAGAVWPQPRGVAAPARRQRVRAAVLEDAECREPQEPGRVAVGADARPGDNAL